MENKQTNLFSETAYIAVCGPIQHLHASSTQLLAGIRNHQKALNKVKAPHFQLFTKKDPLFGTMESEPENIFKDRMIVNLEKS